MTPQREREDFKAGQTDAYRRVHAMLCGAGHEYEHCPRVASLRGFPMAGVDGAPK